MSTTSNKISSLKKLDDLITFFYRYRATVSSAADPPFATQRNFRNHLFSSITYYNNNHGCSINSGLIRFINTAKPVLQVNYGKPASLCANDDDKKVQPKGPPPSKNSGFSTWAKCILSSIVAVWLSFSEKWRRLLVLEEEVEKVVEEVAEAVDKVATATEKMSAEVAEKIPENSPIKKAAMVVEHVSIIAASDAELTKDFIHKVEEVKQDLEDLETMAEPLVDKIKHLKIQDSKQ